MDTRLLNNNQSTLQLFGSMPRGDVAIEHHNGEKDAVLHATDRRPSLADFDCHEELGRGGNAIVYLATLKATAQRVALKVIHGDPGADPKYLARFHREVANASVLVHPHVCRVFCFGADDNVLWLAMEFVEGGTVRDLIDRTGRLPPQIAALLTAQLLDALGAAHAAGIVHRDIKPANVMVTAAGDVKLVDFGIAKSKDDPIVTETGFLVGTPAYMSPEHVVGRELDARTDLYAVGVSLYEMLLGDNPYVNDTPSQALLRIALESLPSIFEQDPTVPGAIEAVFEHLTERRVEDRVGSAHAALSELRDYVDYVQLIYPGLLARFVADPQGVCATLRQDQADLEVARAEHLLLAGDANFAAAGLAFFRAQKLDPSAHVIARFETVCARGKLRFGAADDEELQRARASFVAAPTQAGPVKRVADLYRARGDIHRFVVFIRRYLRLRPSDSHALHQLEICVAGVPSPTRGADGRLRTREILAGVRTGGWAAVPDTHKEAVLALQQPALGRRPATAPTLPMTSMPLPQRASSTTVSADDATARIRAAAVARTSSSSSSSLPGAFSESASPTEAAWGRRLFVVAVVLIAFAAIAWQASKIIKSAVDTTQVVLGDNAAAAGDIEVNDVSRRQNNLLKDVTSYFNAGDHLNVVLAVNALLTSNPPARVALPALLTRARSRARLRQSDAARIDYELYLSQTPLTDPLRTAAMNELNGLLGTPR